MAASPHVSSPSSSLLLGGARWAGLCLQAGPSVERSARAGLPNRRGDDQSVLGRSAHPRGRLQKQRREGLLSCFCVALFLQWEAAQAICWVPTSAAVASCRATASFCLWPRGGAQDGAPETRFRHRTPHSHAGHPTAMPDRNCTETVQKPFGDRSRRARGELEQCPQKPLFERR